MNTIEEIARITANKLLQDPKKLYKRLVTAFLINDRLMPFLLEDTIVDLTEVTKYIDEKVKPFNQKVEYINILLCHKDFKREANVTLSEVRYFPKDFNLEEATIFNGSSIETDYYSVKKVVFCEKNIEITWKSEKLV